MFYRLGQLALLSERSAPVVVGVGRVRLNLQDLLVMFDRRGQLALPSEQSTPVVVGVGRGRLDAQGLLVVFARLDQLARSEEHTSELQSHSDLVCRLLLEKKKK